MISTVCDTLQNTFASVIRLEMTGVEILAVICDPRQVIAPLWASIFSSVN